MVMFILIGSTAFSLGFRGRHGDRCINDALTRLPGGQVSFLLVSRFTLLILGCFIALSEITLKITLRIAGR